MRPVLEALTGRMQVTRDGLYHRGQIRRALLGDKRRLYLTRLCRVLVTPVSGFHQRPSDGRGRRLVADQTAENAQHTTGEVLITVREVVGDLDQAVVAL